MGRVWCFGADVDTDQILPGRYAPYLQPEKEVADFAFIEARPDFAAEARPGDVVVAGANFGCGSSREYAPEALKRRGIAAVIAPSFARIFYRNSINLGLPLIVSTEIPEALTEGDLVELDFEKSELRAQAGIFELPPMPPFAAAIIQAGSITAFIKEHGNFPDFEV